MVYEGHKMQSAQYRRFNITGIIGGDDYAAMRQVLTRRYSRFGVTPAAAAAVVADVGVSRVDVQPDSSEDAVADATLAVAQAEVADAQSDPLTGAPLAAESAGSEEPLLDAALAEPAVEAAAEQPTQPKGRRRRRSRPARGCPTWCWWTAAAARSSMAREVFQSLGLDISRIIGVEKGEGRKVGLEELVFADGREKLTLPAGLRRADAGGADPRRGAPLRDHGHAREARERAHGRGSSKLEEIAGIGAKKRAKLLQRFGGVRGVGAASVEELMAVDGISQDTGRGNLPCAPLTTDQRGAPAAGAGAARPPRWRLCALSACHSPAAAARARRAPAPSAARRPRRMRPPRPRPTRARRSTIDRVPAQAAARIIAANPKITYTTPAPDPLMAIPVLEIEVNGDGSVRHITVIRVPTQATETVQSPSPRSGARRRSATPRTCRSRGSSPRCSCSTKTAASSRASSTERSPGSRTADTHNARHAMQGRMPRCSSRSPLC